MRWLGFLAHSSPILGLLALADPAIGARASNADLGVITVTDPEVRQLMLLATKEGPQDMQHLQFPESAGDGDLQAIFGFTLLAGVIDIADHILLGTVGGPVDVAGLECGPDRRPALPAEHAGGVQVPLIRVIEQGPRPSVHIETCLNPLPERRLTPFSVVGMGQTGCDEQETGV